MDHRIASLEEDLTTRALENIQTKLYGPLNAPFFTYNMVPWTLHVRKEVMNHLHLSLPKTKESEINVSYCLASDLFSFRKPWTPSGAALGLLSGCPGHVQRRLFEDQSRGSNPHATGTLPSLINENIKQRGQLALFVSLR